jgi:cytochrome c-type biogenesis protein CcmH
MIWLAVVALLIAAATAWYMARPLARTTVADNRVQRHQLAQLRDRLLVQLDELDVEEGDRNIDTTVLADERNRLEAELAAVLHELETPKDKKKKKQAKAESRHAWAIALAVFGIVLPLSAAGLYALYQRPVLAYLSNPEAPADASVPPDVMKMVERLEQRLSEQPDDAAGWFRLGRTYAVLGRGEAANAAYARAYQLTPDDPELVAEYAAFLYEGDPQNTGGQVLGLFTRLHQLDPENRDALWFLGFAAYQKGDHKQALGYWDRLLKSLPADSPEAEHMRAIIARIRGNAVKK